MNEQNQKNTNKDELLPFVLVIIICYILISITWGALENIIKSNKEKDKPTTASEGTVRDIGAIDLTEVFNWKDSPYKQIQPQQIAADLEAINESKDSDLEFTYTWDGKDLFKIGTSNMDNKPYLELKSTGTFDFNKWSLFKSDDKIVFSSTDNNQMGLNEEFDFISFSKDGTVEIQTKYIDLLGYDEEYDEFFTLPAIDATVVRSDNVLRLVRAGVVLDERVFPDGIQKSYMWAIDNHFIADDGSLYYVMIDKSDLEHPTINCVKAGEGVKEREKPEFVYNADGDKWKLFTDKNGKDVAFVMDSEIWKQSTISCNRLIAKTEETEASYIPASEWNVKKISVDKPSSFKLEYNKDTTDKISPVFSNEKASWIIRFYYGEKAEVYTYASVPGIDENILLSDEDVNKFNGKTYDITKLDSIRSELMSVYESYINNQYENYLKNN